MSEKHFEKLARDMTLQEWYAGQALVGLCTEGDGETPMATLAFMALIAADAMMQSPDDLVETIQRKSSKEEITEAHKKWSKN